MHHSSLPAASSTPSSPIHTVFDDWLKAVSAFQESYNQLNQYVLCTTDSERASPFVAQCSTNQVDEVRTKMCQELETLVTELDRPLDLSRLMDHTVRLRLLTNQASLTICLLHQSSC